MSKEYKHEWYLKNKERILNNLQPLEASENLRKSNKYPYNG